MKPTSSARRSPGTKEYVEPSGDPNCVSRREIQPHRSGRRCRDKVNPASDVMAKRKTELAIVVRQQRRLVAAQAGRQNGRRAARREPLVRCGLYPRGSRERMVVPTEQRRLYKNCKKCRETRPRCAAVSISTCGSDPWRRRTSTARRANAPALHSPLDHTIHHTATPRSPFAMPARILS
jgi:hypothetical protein